MQLILPSWLTEAKEAPAVMFVDCRGQDLTDAETIERVNRRLVDVYASFLGEHGISGQTLNKLHVGEPAGSTTRLRPQFVRSSRSFLENRGAETVVAGDSTVAYTGPRGHRENPEEDTSKYRELAAANGWAADGEAGMPFVILDRPQTGSTETLSFDEEEIVLAVDGIARFSDFFAAGGFRAADFVMNHAHCTLHTLSGFAGCTKNIAMGCAALRGKYRMHQCLLPTVDGALCTACRRCVSHCPEEALLMPDDSSVPEVDPERCIGCGECAAACRRGAITLHSQEIDDWTRGAETISFRMADYTLGLMQDRWDRCLHILHMYAITPLCDCVDVRQVPIAGTEIGFLVGKNPFAVDRFGAMLLEKAAAGGGEALNAEKVAAASATEKYVRDTYGIVSPEDVTTVAV